MTIPSTVTKTSLYNGNDVQTTFAYNFWIPTESDIEVVLRSAAGVETVLTLTTHYTITDAGVPAGGTIEMVTAPATGEKLIGRRKQDFLQNTDLQTQGGFLPEVHETVFDKLTTFTQQIQEEVDRSVKVDLSSSTTPDNLIDDINAAVVAAQAAQAAAELAKTGAETAETNAQTAQTAAELAETNAETAETNAAASETKAGKWADEAEDVAVETGPNRYSAFHWSQKAQAQTAIRHGEKRQTVIQGKRTANFGRANAVYASGGLNVGLYGTEARVLATFAKGFDINGPVDLFGQGPATDNTTFFGALPAGTAGSLRHHFMYLEHDGISNDVTGGVVSDYSPKYGDNFWLALNNHGRSSLNFESTNGDTNPQTDNNGDWSWSANTGAQISVAQAKFGGSSGYFNSFGGHYSVSQAFYAAKDRGGFSVSCFVRFNAFNDLEDYIFGTSNNFRFALGVTPTTHSLKMWLGNGSSWTIANGVSGGGALSTNTWYHIAVIYDGLQYTIYIDGVAQFSVASGTEFEPGTGFQIGTAFSSANGIGAFVDDFRYETGDAHRPSSFTPPVRAGSLPGIDEHWFDTVEMKMKRWDDPTGTWVEVNRVFIAEATSNATAAQTPINYGYQGKYDTGLVNMSVAADYNFDHDLGMDAQHLNIDYLVREHPYLATAINPGVQYNSTALVRYGGTPEVINRNEIEVNHVGGATEYAGSPTFTPKSFVGSTPTSFDGRLIISRRW